MKKTMGAMKLRPSYERTESLKINTFLPYPSFPESARVLDNRRLGKQRIEALQILKTLAGESRGWRNHPAVLMWRGYEFCLVRYGIEICREWTRRGFRDTTCEKIATMASKFVNESRGCNPPWLGNEAFHRSHQSNLLRKDPEHYRKFFRSVPDNLPYLWPVRQNDLEAEHNG